MRNEVLSELRCPQCVRDASVGIEDCLKIGRKEEGE